MATTDAGTTFDELADLVEESRDAWREYQATIENLMPAMRHSPSNGIAHEVRRIEAYGALVGRDEGMGQSMEGWLDEIADEIRIERDAADMAEGDAR